MHMFSLPVFYPRVKLKDVFRKRPRLHGVQKMVWGGELPEVFLGVCFVGHPEADPGHTGGFHVSPPPVIRRNNLHHIMPERFPLFPLAGSTNQDYKEMQTHVQQPNGEDKLKAAGKRAKRKLMFTHSCVRLPPA